MTSRVALDDEDPGTALHRAVTRNDLARAEALLEEGAAIDGLDDDGNTPLYALLKGEPVDARGLAHATWLVERGAGLNVRGASGRTALHWAAKSAPLAFTRMLVDKGAKVSRDHSEETPLFVCLATWFKDEEVWSFLIEQGCALTDVNDRRQTALHAAVENHNAAAVTFLLKRGADRTAKDAHGKTAVGDALQFAKKLVPLFSP